MYDMHNLPKGMKFIRVLRRSKAKQHESLERQRELIDIMLRNISGIAYDEVVLDDHSSTYGEQWDAYYRVIERKKNGENFDGVIASEYARIGRNMDDCEEYVRCLKRAQLQLVTHKEGVMIGRDKWITRIGAAHGNEKYAESVSVNMNGGIMALIKRGILPHAQVPTYGLDRLHVSQITGKPLFRLRWTTDKTILRLTPNDVSASNPICVYEGLTRDDYPRRQRDERVELVMGDKAQLDVVRRIFSLRYEHSYSYSELASVLNDEMIKSPYGMEWEFVSVRAILENESFTGIGVCNKQGCGVHSWRGKDGPITFGLPRESAETMKGADRRKPEMVVRPVKDWFVGRCPNLLPILGRKLRRLAKAANRKRRHTPLSMHRSLGIRKSTFFLSGLIRETNTKAKMFGISTKVVNGVPYRYYYLDRHGARKCEYQKLAIKSIRAEHIEEAFFAIVSELLAQSKNTERLILEMLKQRISDRSRNARLTNLIDEKTTHQRRLDLILSVNAKFRKNAQQDAQKLVDRLSEIEADIASVREMGDITDVSEFPKIVRNVMIRLANANKVARAGVTRDRARLARLLCESIWFDAITGVVTFNFRLPRLFITNPEMMDQLFWKAVNARTKDNGFAKPQTSVFLGKFEYKLVTGHGGKLSQLVRAANVTNRKAA